MIKACVFDLDGTLLNTLPTIAHYANRALARYGIAPYKVEDYPAFVGNGSRELLRRALAGRGAEGVDFERFHAEYVQDYDSAPSYMTRPYEGIDELLSLLREYKQLDPRSYRAIRFGTLLCPCVCHTPIGKGVVIAVYRLMKKIIKYG